MASNGLFKGISHHRLMGPSGTLASAVLASKSAFLQHHHASAPIRLALALLCRRALRKGNGGNLSQAIDPSRVFFKVYSRALSLLVPAGLCGSSHC